jgi:hypothetical protein
LSIKGRNSTLYGSIGEEWKALEVKIRFNRCFLGRSHILLADFSAHRDDPSRKKLEDNVASNQQGTDIIKRSEIIEKNDKVINQDK